MAFSACPVTDRRFFYPKKRQPFPELPFGQPEPAGLHGGGFRQLVVELLPCIVIYSIIAIIKIMKYEIKYYSGKVQEDILALPKTLRAKYLLCANVMKEHGANIGRQYTASFGDGLFELRLKGAEGIGRVFFCYAVGNDIVMLHSFIKKTQKTPQKEKDIAVKRMKEIKNGKAIVS